jgi:hypothetical protein
MANNCQELFLWTDNSLIKPLFLVENGKKLASSLIIGQLLSLFIPLFFIVHNLVCIIVVVESSSTLSLSSVVGNGSIVGASSTNNLYF